MYALSELKGKTVLICGGAPGKEELRRILGALQMDSEDVVFITPDEIKAEGELVCEHDYRYVCNNENCKVMKCIKCNKMK